MSERQTPEFIKAIGKNREKINSLEGHVAKLYGMVNATTVRLCVCTDCANNRAGLGEYACNCREIEIQEGRCRQYIKQEKPIPLKFT